ncbi:hypothetical protein TEA_025853 [Camellia sinensis var. sinensis]|uniref:Glutathione peroxidase n=1 Tax=Camellia sinensis var. sinensis TaxID=542762 RepID=A0A4S4DVJ5_CAMSN|nr:hypothetical protein TEA_025853 [Camellia sinensis var. sinensis]
MELGLRVGVNDFDSEDHRNSDLLWRPRSARSMKRLNRVDPNGEFSRETNTNWFCVLNCFSYSISLSPRGWTEIDIENQNCESLRLRTRIGELENENRWNRNPSSPPASQSMAGEETPKSIYDFTVKDIRGNDVPLSNYNGKVVLIVNVASKWQDIRGNDVPLSNYNGKVVLIVNVASKWQKLLPPFLAPFCSGLTQSNYKELNILYEKYKDQGFEILAFPSNQFWQEPGTNEKIQETACTMFKAEFPVFEKIDVNGKNAAPLYKFLKSEKGGILGDGIKWNYTKFLVSKEGKVVERYAPTLPPLKIEVKNRRNSRCYSNQADEAAEHKPQRKLALHESPGWYEIHEEKKMPMHFYFPTDDFLLASCNNLTVHATASS